MTEGSQSYTTAVDITLSTGANELSFSDSAGYPISNGSYAGVSLFFTSSGSFNPSSGSAVPDLSAFSSFSGSGVSVPRLGVAEPNYATAYPDASTDSYSGDSSYALGGYDVAITELSFSGTAGTMELTVSALPEPVSGGLLLLTVIGTALHRARRSLL